METLGWIRPPGGLVDIAFLFAINSPFGGARGCGFFEASTIFLPSDVDCAADLDDTGSADGADDLVCVVLAAVAASKGEGSNAEPFNIAPRPPSSAAGLILAKKRYMSPSRERLRTFSSKDILSPRNLRRRRCSVCIFLLLFQLTVWHLRLCSRFLLAW